MLSSAGSDVLLIPSNVFLIQDILAFISKRFCLGPSVFLMPQLKFFNMWATVILPSFANSGICISYGLVLMHWFFSFLEATLSADLYTYSSLT